MLCNVKGEDLYTLGEGVKNTDVKGLSTGSDGIYPG
jgi:hypothetical protein